MRDNVVYFRFLQFRNSSRLSQGQQETHTEFPQCGCKNITKNSDLSNKKQIWKQFGTSYLEYLRNFGIQNLSKFKAKYWPLQLVPISHQ